MSILAIQNPTYQPAMRIISNIVKGFPTGIVTTFAHNYSTGLIVRINIPPGYGMTQINQLYAPIFVVNSTSFLIGIDSTEFDDFVVPGSYPDSYQSAQVTPIGEISETIYYATRNVLPIGAT